jgi:CBS domain-containing protein
MNVSDVMTGDVTLVDMNTSVADVARVMQDENTGSVAVTDKDTLVGMITERDMVLGCLLDGHVSWECEAYQHMTIMERASTPDMDAGEALVTMLDFETSCLPVVAESGRIVGMVFSEDLSRAISQENDPEPTLMNASFFS